tara:strand:- start:278 stop:610 length:333 start_codon:yes stop_codon:yes gene_type:complete
MFLAGKKSSVLKSDTSKEVICPKCNTINSTQISILGIYKHLLQIPFLSGGKTGISNCNDCKTKFNLDNMPALIKLAYFELKETTKTPIWFFTGLIVIKTLVLIKIFSRYF